MPNSIDVVVIGAGLSGLTAARLLRASGRSVLVLEARDRPGGRMYGFDVDGRSIQIGGRWIGPGQDRVKSLAEEFGIEAIEHDGFEDAGSVIGGAGEELRALARRIEALAESVPLEAPWTTPNARELDGQTLATWLSANAPADVATAMGTSLTSFLPEPQDLSFLHTLFYTKSNGGLVGILGLDGKAHDNGQFVGGAHRLTDALYHDLEAHVRLNTPVWKIVHDRDQVQVHTADGRVSAGYAIVAMPPVLAGRLQYDPPMPPDRDYLTQRMPIRGKIAVALLYAEPFWRDGSDTTLVADEDVLLWDEGGDHRPVVLAGLISIRRSRELAGLDAATRKETILGYAARHFGNQATQLSDYYEINWAAEPWSR
ncbi:MAG: FAD-dependent oxidoreductase, partial [Rhodospirillaceae bacterium]|nr:FAD-dependent oxidoreductase [Rhodospirillaceae bacterium]